MKKLLYLMIFAAPLGAKVFSVDLGFFILSPFRMLFLLAVVVMVLIALSGNRRIYVIRRRANAYSLKVYYAWFFIALISVIWAKDIAAWAKTIIFIGIGVFLIIMFCNYFTKEHDIYRAFAALQAGIAIQAVIGWYEIVTRNYKWLELTDKNLSIYVNGIDRIPIAMQTNPNNFATLMLVGIGISAICATVCEKKVMQRMNIVLGFNYALLLVATTSRANIAALIFLVAAWLLMTEKRKWLIPLSVVLCIVLSPWIIAFIQKYFLLAYDAHSSNSIRLNLILNGLIFLVDTFGIGVGAGQAEFWMAKRAVFGTSGLVNLHNYWIEILTCYGVLFFMAYMVFYCRLFMSMRRHYKNPLVSDKQKNVSLYIAALMVGFIVGSISSSSLISLEWNWVLWGIVISYQGIMCTESKQTVQ